MELPDRDLSNANNVTAMFDQIKKLTNNKAVFNLNPLLQEEFKKQQSCNADQDRNLNNKENLLNKLDNQFGTQNKLFLHKSDTIDLKKGINLESIVKNEVECDEEYQLKLNKSFVNNSNLSSINSIFEEDMEKSNLSGFSTHNKLPVILNNNQKTITQNHGVKRLFGEISQKTPLCASTPLNNKTVYSNETNKLNEQVFLYIAIDFFFFFIDCINAFNGQY